MKGKRILAAALSAAMLLGSAAQAAVAPAGSEYVEVRISVGKEAMSKANYVALAGQLSGTPAERAAKANSAFTGGSERIQAAPGETVYLAIKVDGSRIWAPYVGAGNYNLYYSYDPSVFTFNAGDGYINMLTAGRAGIEQEEGNLEYLGNYGVMINSKMQVDDKTYLAIGVLSETYKYYIPTAAEWDFVVPVSVSPKAYAGTYTIGFEEENFGGQFRYAIMLGKAANGTNYLQDFGAADLNHLKANDITIEVVNAPARPTVPDTPDKSDREPIKGFYVNGRPDGSFGAADGIRRDEFVKMLTVATGLYSAETTYPNTFPDVSPANWAAPYISTAVAKGLVTGLPDGTFGAARTITRGEAAAILARVMKLEKSDSRPFSDLEGDWAAGYVAALADGGYVKGYSDGTFRSSDVLHRVEAVKMINSALGVSFTPEETAQAKTIPSPFTDVAPGYWAYADILYAAGLIEK